MKTVKYIPHHNMKYSICSNMKNNLDIKKNDGICEVFDSYEDLVERVKAHIPEESGFSELSEFFKYLKTQQD